MRNKRSQHLACALDAVGLNLPERLAELLPQLSADKQADVLLGLMTFVYPKLKAVEQTLIEEKPIEKITIELVESPFKGMRPITKE